MSRASTVSFPSAPDSPDGSIRLGGETGLKKIKVGVRMAYNMRQMLIGGGGIGAHRQRTNSISVPNQLSPLPELVVLHRCKTYSVQLGRSPLHHILSHTLQHVSPQEVSTLVPTHPLIRKSVHFHLASKLELSFNTMANLEAIVLKLPWPSRAVVHPIVCGKLCVMIKCRGQLIRRTLRSHVPQEVGKISFHFKYAV
jgi:hypothetical protein